jgi:hypothetical protein
LTELAFRTVVVGLALLAVTSRWVLRFDAKTPPALPNLPAHHGSFF